MLDMDDVSDVLAAASRFAGAISAANGQVARIARELTPRERPGSAIDAALAGHAEWIRATFDSALAASASRATAVYRRTQTTVRALEDADTISALRINRAESI
ncbi:hypothetical protein [Nocardia brasiliensis]|uniref:hypothetical protein n=1 Tax=Nocardia brasiliensis TaxID=37326 RepID=UPI0024570861|nr:hypothetical protein [Nocardia brasiliensis]